jgi:23S rRNA G2069 N7-methylase RlmK/C1962 C5-methylase RlmI
MLGTAKRVGIDPATFSRSPGTLEQLASKFERVLAPMLNFNDPKGVYAHCLCRFEP